MSSRLVLCFISLLLAAACIASTASGQGVCCHYQSGQLALLQSVLATIPGSTFVTPKVPYYIPYVPGSSVPSYSFQPDLHLCAQTTCPLSLPSPYLGEAQGYFIPGSPIAGVPYTFATLPAAPFNFTLYATTPLSTCTSTSPPVTGTCTDCTTAHWDLTLCCLYFTPSATEAVYPPTGTPSYFIVTPSLTPNVVTSLTAHVYHPLRPGGCAQVQAMEYQLAAQFTVAQPSECTASFL
jgi:hypothetical protein